MKVYTRKGDDGTTQLIGGTRVPKHHVRIEAYGTVDELNAFLGLMADHFSAQAAEGIPDFIKDIQDRLFTLGSSLAADPETSKMMLPDIHAEDVTRLEEEIDKMDVLLPPLKNFVLPGGHPANSTAHIARCVCRRAERLCTHLDELDPINPLILQYLNRLSDYLFVLSRYASFLNHCAEIIWQPRKQ